MARKKEVVYYDEHRLMGKQLTREDCARLDFIRSLDKTGEGLNKMAHLVYRLPEEVVDEMKRLRSDAPVESLVHGNLRPYQTVGVAFCYYAKSAVIGDSVGLGKTHVSGGLINLVSSERRTRNLITRVLFLTDKSAVIDISSELMSITGKYYMTSTGEDLAVEEIVGRSADINRIDSLVASHSIVKSRRFQSWLLDYEDKYGENMFDVIIIDEGSVIAGNSTTAYYKDSYAILNSCPRKILLNATPFESSLETFYNQINFVDDTFLMTKKEFESKYVNSFYNGYYLEKKGYKNSGDFSRKVEFRYFKSTRKELGAVMKDCSADLVTVPLTKGQRELLRRTSMPYQVYDCPWSLDPSVETNKLLALESLVNQLINEQVLIYTRYKDAQAGIEEMLDGMGISCIVLNGDTDNSTRQQAIEDFQDGKVQVLVTNIQKALNFGNCNHCIFYSFDPNPNRMVQVEGRMTRSFDIIDKHVYLITTEGPEYKRISTEIKDRAAASSDFTGRDFSLVLDLLAEKF